MVLDETRSFTVMFMSAPEALAVIASINAVDVVNAQTYNLYPNNETALIQIGAGNLKIQISVMNGGADGTLYVKLVRDDGYVAIDQSLAIPAGNVGTWEATMDMPARNVGFNIEAGHGDGGGNGGEQFTLTISTFEYGGSGYTDPSGIVTQASGTTLQVYAYPTSGAFYEWQLDGVSVGSDNPITITFNANHALVAMFI